MPADLHGAIAIAIGISAGPCDGEGLSDARSALDQKGGVTVIDVGNGERICIDGFVESLPIGVIDRCNNALPF